MGFYNAEDCMKIQHVRVHRFFEKLTTSTSRILLDDNTAYINLLITNESEVMDMSNLNLLHHQKIWIQSIFG